MSKFEGMIYQMILNDRIFIEILYPLDDIKKILNGKSAFEVLKEYGIEFDEKTLKIADEVVSEKFREFEERLKQRGIEVVDDEVRKIIIELFKYIYLWSLYIIDKKIKQYVTQLQ